MLLFSYCNMAFLSCSIHQFEEKNRRKNCYILDDGMRWHDSLLQSLVEHDKRPGLAHAQQMSNLELSEWRHQKQQAFLVAKQARSEGRRLSMERDSKKRSYYDMSATEQQMLEDYDTEKLQKQVNKTSLRVERKPFRGSLRFRREPHE